MKIKVDLSWEEQQKRQTDVWTIFTSTLPPAPKKSIVRLVIAGALIAIAVAVFIVISLNDMETSMTVLGVILLIAGVFVLSGTLFDLLSKTRKKKKLLAQVSEAVDVMFRDMPAAAEAEFDFGKDTVTVTYVSAAAETVKRFTAKLTECAVTSVCDTLAVDFNETDSYCFTAEEIGKDKLLELKKILLAKHESYRDVERDDRGVYYVHAD